jgi:glycosyltransferase involved in cell wall biosynthesis
MKIVILQDQLRLGGTETQALQLGGHWLKAGHEVRLVAFRPGGELAGTAEARAVQPIVLQQRDWGVDWYAPKLRETVAALQPDVVVAFGREANAKLPKLAGLAPRVATVRSGREQPRRYWKGVLGAELAVANSRWAAQTALTHGVPKIKLQAIYNGLARVPLPADAAAARAEWRKQARTPEEAVVMVCVAGFRLGKGQDLLLRAAAKLESFPPWQLWLVGDGPLIKGCRQLAAHLELNKTVRFTGWVEDPAPFFAAADFAVMASEAESLPNFLIEAQAAGLPVVTTAVGGAEECFEERKTGWSVPALNIEAMTEAMKKTIGDPEWRAAARERAMERARRLFDPEKNAAKWLGLFGDLKGAGKPSS